MLTILAGCDAKSAPVAQSPNSPAPSTTAAQPAIQPPAISPPSVSPPAISPPAVSQSAANPTLDPNQEAVKAQVGVGEAGRGYGGDIITEPIKQYFGLREKIAFDYLTKAMNEYKALHDFQGPPSHDVFWKEIVQAYNINLPRLPAGQSYIYDPATEQLMVQRPRKPGDK
jgi:hypothetical protein